MFAVRVTCARGVPLADARAALEAELDRCYVAKILLHEYACFGDACSGDIDDIEATQRYDVCVAGVGEAATHIDSAQHRPSAGTSANNYYLT